MTRDEYLANISSILRYSGNYSSNELMSLLLVSDTAQVQEAYDNHPSELDNPNIQKIATALTSIIPAPGSGNAKFSHEIIDEFVKLIKGKDVKEDDKKLIQECVRITPMDVINGNEEELKYILNNSSIYDPSKKWKDAKTDQFTLVNAVKLKCHESFTKTNDFPTKLKPRCTVIELLKPGLGAAARDTKEVSIFTNMVTSLEMSRCVPYLRVKIVPPKYVDNQGQQIKMPAYFNIIGFLKGDKGPLEESKLSASDFALSMTMGDSGKVDGGGSMELFTSPQTMMTPRGNLGNFSNNVLDRARPFMSITGVKISVKPAAGLYAYKTATIDLVLHDRSRLGEIAPFIKPDIFAGANKTTFEIEYGWSHPDGNKQTAGRFKNPIGAFLNGLRCLENYEVYNATYSFAEAGQVNISLQLTMKSHSSLLAKSPTITDVKEAIDSLDFLTKDINAKMKAVTGGNETQMKSLKEIFPEILMNGVSSGDAAMSMDLTKFSELQRKMNDIKSGATNQKTKELSAEISELLTKAKQAQDNASTAAANKITNLINGTEIFPVSFTKTGAPSTSVSIPTVISPARKDTISLGRILHAYVAAPIAATNEFAEVQLIFGVHNERASFMRSLSIARHPIDKEAFKKEVTEFVKKKPKMTIAEFISLLNEKFVSNTAAFAHGFSNAQPAKAQNGDQSKEDIKSHDLQSKIIIEDAKILDGNYRPPSLSLTTECVVASNGELILRILVTDGSASVHQTYVDLLRSVRDVSSNVANVAGIDPTHPLVPKAPEVRSIGKSKSKLIDFLQKKGVLTSASKESKAGPATSDTAVKVSAMSLVEDASKLKSVISKGLPYIRYGQGSGAITSIGVSSLSDPALANAALSVAGQNSSYMASNADQYRGIPMRVTPAEVSMEMLGCPILNIAQHFFVDLDTQTTLDGIYTISGVDHSFSPGSFSTSVKLINTCDGYMSFRSAGSELSSAVSRWLQEDPDAKAAVQKADAVRAAAAKAKKDKDDASRQAAQAANDALLQQGVDAAKAKQISEKAQELISSWQSTERRNKALPKLQDWGKEIAAEEGFISDSFFVDDLQRAMENAIEICAYQAGGGLSAFIAEVIKRWSKDLFKNFDDLSKRGLFNHDKYEGLLGESFSHVALFAPGDREAALISGYHLHDVKGILFSAMEILYKTSPSGDDYQSKLKEFIDQATKDLENNPPPPDTGESESA